MGDSTNQPSTWGNSCAGTTYTQWLVGTMWDDYRDDAAGSSGVREPRRPIRPPDTAGAALDVPRDELEWAIERGQALAARYGW